MFNGFYKGKRVLVTGHTGFKGGWLSLWLDKLGASVWGIGLQTPTNPNLYELIKSKCFKGESECDVRNLDALAAAVREVQPEVVFHLAAQPIVRLSYAEPLETFHINAVGTANVLEAVRRAELPCVVIVVTSDKCYENREWEFAYRETDNLGGHDPYSMSKGAAELIAQTWNKSFFKPNPKLGPVVTVRAGNVIGGGDYAADRIVPDCVRALLAKKPIAVRNPSAVRPWQHVLECLSGYLWLAARLGKEPKTSPLVGPFNFGPQTSSRQPVVKLVTEFLKHWPGKWEDKSDPNSLHEAALLSLSIEKASSLLGWYPCWDFGETIQRTALWYQKRQSSHADMLGFSSAQIDDYCKAAKEQDLSWTNS